MGKNIDWRPLALRYDHHTPENIQPADGLEHSDKQDDDEDMRYRSPQDSPRPFSPDCLPLLPLLIHTNVHLGSKKVLIVNEF